MEEKKYPLIKQEFCSKLEEYETKLKKGGHMEPQDYEIIKTIYSGLVKMEAYKGMMESGDYSDPEETEGMSGRRGRAMNGRYVSRDNGQSYSDGYTEGYTTGYSEAMSQMNGNSGHWPPPYPTRRY